MTQVKPELCTMLYANEAYFTPNDLTKLYCAYPGDHHSLLVYVEEDADDLSELSESAAKDPVAACPQGKKRPGCSVARAQAMLSLAKAHGVAWLRLRPDVEPFEELPPVVLYSSALNTQTAPYRCCID